MLSISTVSIAAPECDEPFSHKVDGVIPFAEGFPESIITEGTLIERMTQFQNKWPDNVKLVKNVKMKVDFKTNKKTRSQDFLVVTTNGLDEVQKVEMAKDYLDSISHNTMEFFGKNHLYTRVGTKSLDYVEQVDVADFKFSNSDRIQTVLELSPQELDNLRWYTYHATTNYDGVLGESRYEGVKVSNGKINDNKCPVGGHNCTSWMGLAPIGKNGEPVKELIGANGWDIARNPGWLAAFIHAYTPKARTPFNVFSTKKDWATLDAMIATDKNFEWEYDLH